MITSEPRPKQKETPLSLWLADFSLLKLMQVDAVSLDESDYSHILMHLNLKDDLWEGGVGYQKFYSAIDQEKEKHKKNPSRKALLDFLEIAACSFDALANNFHSDFYVEARAITTEYASLRFVIEGCDKVFPILIDLREPEMFGVAVDDALQNTMYAYSNSVLAKVNFSM